MKKVEATEQQEDFEEELIQAKPVIINNIKAIIGPVPEDDMLIIGKAK